MAGHVALRSVDTAVFQVFLRSTTAHLEFKRNAGRNATTSVPPGSFRTEADLPVITLPTMLYRLIFKGYYNRMHELQLYEKQLYGPMYKIRSGNSYKIFLNSVELLEEVMRKDDKFPSRGDTLWSEYRDMKGLGYGPATEEGEKWYQLRSLLNKRMLHPKDSVKYENVVNEVVTDFIKRICHLRLMSSTGDLVPNISNELYRFSLEGLREGRLSVTALRRGRYSASGLYDGHCWVPILHRKRHSASGLRQRRRSAPGLVAQLPVSAEGVAPFPVSTLGVAPLQVSVKGVSRSLLSAVDGIQALDSTMGTAGFRSFTGSVTPPPVSANVVAPHQVSAEGIAPLQVPAAGVTPSRFSAMAVSKLQASVEDFAQPRIVARDVSQFQASVVGISPLPVSMGWSLCCRFLLWVSLRLQSPPRASPCFRAPWMASLRLLSPQWWSLRFGPFPAVDGVSPPPVCAEDLAPFLASAWGCALFRVVVPFRLSAVVVASLRALPCCSRLRGGSGRVPFEPGRLEGPSTECPGPPGFLLICKYIGVCAFPLCTRILGLLSLSTAALSLPERTPDYLDPPGTAVFVSLCGLSACVPAQRRAFPSAPVDYSSRADLLTVSSRSLRFCTLKIDAKGSKSVGISAGISRILFETRIGCLENEIPAETQNFINSIGQMFTYTMAVTLLPKWTRKYSPFWYCYISAWDGIFKFACKLIDRKMEDIQMRLDAGQEVAGEYLSYLLTNTNMSKKDVYGSVAELLLAGVDTTSNTMMWALYQLSQNPKIQDTLYQEVNSIIKGDKIPTAEDITNMPYLKAVIKETLRMYPVVPTNARLLSEKDVVIGGHFFPKKTVFIMNHYAISHDEKIFPQPKVFKPERWLRDGRERPYPFGSIPFGFGVRGCVGKRIAELEMHLVLARIIKQFEVKLDPNVEAVKALSRILLVADKTVNFNFLQRKHITT
ncbi:hypothetical protein C0J45_2970 [Silurus meridionalis]|nr:hypothetical protein C0J45_2970 [Silurus meridionalis]